MDNKEVVDLEEATAKISELFKKHEIVVMVGGSGMYVKSILEGLDDFPEIDPQIREHLNESLAQNGLQSLQEQLKKLQKDF